MKKGKIMMSVAMAAVVGVASMGGCNRKGSNVTAEKESLKSLDVARVESNKLVVAIQTNSYVTDYDNNYLTNYLEDKLGMEIEFYQLPAATEEVRTKISLMAASDNNLPDILIVDNALTPETILEYGSSGVFLPLNEYTEDPSKMPNYAAIPEKDKMAMEEAQMMADGRMYSLSKFEPETWNMTPNRMFINRAWMDTLGLEMPRTTGELKAVLKEFCEKDPNGNGVKDEMGGMDISQVVMGRILRQH